ncbi:MAG TPA: hypothetical protein VKU85_06175, partial [bacterium]|nr:hypothetical protein [bacterium]
MLAPIACSCGTVSRSRGGRCGFIAAVAACGLASCARQDDAPPPPPTDRVASDWLQDGTVQRETERGGWDPVALTGPWTSGRHPWIRDDGGGPYLWSHLAETRWSAEIVRPGPRRLVLDGFPAPSPDGLPQRVDLRVDDHLAGSAEWTGPARRTLDVPGERLAPGVHRISLRYR